MERQGEQGTLLTLDMVLLVLRANRQTCQVRAEVSLAQLATAMGKRKAERGKEHVMGLIELRLQDGQVATAFVYDPAGQTLAAGESALGVARRCGVLSWIVRPLPSTDKLPAPLPPGEPREGRKEEQSFSSQRPPAFPPRRTNLAYNGIDTLPRKHRQVLLLIDGKRGMDELCRILNCTPDQLNAICEDLRAWQLIKFPQNPR
ncbi:hypothetical protein EPA93_08855 [Ktedonosporobacter rubrisoli]|uniref:DUF4388 domain-containing protein n=1 Tax=Ktedonosporobacter rubrisoli TaxID=2509675 RepID=A0A4P6JM77_KTERU|nr:hypothetical protein [Ktedonosporobacter rubrisoli]QBD76112.1 hypothetical protein EPA93_08855 [Ktedonosporobacter rubrisoli]